MAKAKEEPAVEEEVVAPIDLSGVLEGAEVWQEYRAVRHIRAEQFHEDFSFTDADGEAHTGLAGDYIVYGYLGDFWVEPQEAFQARFKPLSPNKT